MTSIFKRVVVFILTWEARAVLLRYKPQIIVVTGSVGKTTTKDAIYAAICEDVHVRKNEKSFNSEIGVPLVILGCANAWNNPFLWVWNILKGASRIVVRQTYPEWLILELGADKPGDIRNAARWIKPDIAVITGVPDVPVHVEAFESPDAVYEEKISVIPHLKAGGTLILNGDDRRLSRIEAMSSHALITYGFGEQCSCIGAAEKITYDKQKKPKGMSCTATIGGLEVTLTTDGALGRPRLYGALAALAVAHVLKVPTEKAAELLHAWSPPHGRMTIIHGLQDTTIIDDTYNASPAATASALHTLNSIRGAKRKIAVLADMLELGKYSADAHREVGESIAGYKFDLLVTVGFRARGIAEAAIRSGMPASRVKVFEHETSSFVGTLLAPEVCSGDVVLVKGSQSMRMEKIVFALMKEPERASELLIRQDTDWRRR